MPATRSLTAYWSRAMSTVAPPGSRIAPAHCNTEDYITQLPTSGVVASSRRASTSGVMKDIMTSQAGGPDGGVR
ncbi:hypothetical protein Nm8I071_21840 [Nonomuraea sp. TT08I-71]|nr:hypothetical protein Nm8I071_21840 [Nonomuraea sp. TT08I-71]